MSDTILKPRNVYTEEDFNKTVKSFLSKKNIEDISLEIYGDHKGLATVGIGYCLSKNENWKQDFIASDINRTEAEISRIEKLLQDLPTKKTKAEKKALIDEYNQDKNATTFTNEEVDNLFYTILAQKKAIVKSELGKDIYEKLDNSDEMVALASFAFQNRTLLGNNLETAIKNDDRLSAVYEIEFKSNRERLFGVHTRRNEEAKYFGIFKDDSNITQDEAIKAIKFYDGKKDEIDNYLSSLKHTNGKKDTKTKKEDEKYINEQKQNLSDRLKPAKDLLAQQYLKGELKFDEKDKVVEDIIKKHIELKQNEFLAQFYMNYKNNYNHENPAYELSFKDTLEWEVENAKKMGDDYVSEEAKEIALRMSSGEDLDLTAEMKLEPTLSSKIDNSAVLAAFQPLLAKEEALEDKKVEIKETNQENLEANQTQQNAYDQEAKNQEQIKQQEQVAEQIKKDQDEFEQKKQDIKDKVWNAAKTVAGVATFIPPLTVVGLPIKGAMLLGKGYALLKGIRMTHDALELASFAKEAVEYDKEATAYVNSQTGKVEQVIDNTQGINLENKENLTAQFNPSFS